MSLINELNDFQSPGDSGGGAGDGRDGRPEHDHHPQPQWDNQRGADVGSRDQSGSHQGRH